MESVSAGSIADEVGIEDSDIIKAVIINGEQKEVLRSFNLSDIAMTLRPGDKIQFVVERGGSTVTTATHTIVSSDFTKVS